MDKDLKQVMLEDDFLTHEAEANVNVVGGCCHCLQKKKNGGVSGRLAILIHQVMAVTYGILENTVHCPLALQEQHPNAHLEFMPT